MNHGKYICHPKKPIMKTTNRFSIIMAIVLLSFSIHSCNKNKEIRLKTITLYVDTDNINQQNKDSTHISNFGQALGVSNQDFTTDVEMGEDILWIGVSSSSPETDKVYITRIKHKKGKKFFKNLELKGKKKVRGKVKDKGFKEGDSMKYSVKFTVIKKGNSNKQFIIDPKLRMTN